jgi:pectinesterase
VDYVFGAASAWFTQTTLTSVGSGAITASSREKRDDPGWYVFDRCTMTSRGSKMKNAVHLGRPWRKLARVMFQNSVLGDSIRREGWGTMAKGATPLFYEWRNSGPGSNTSQRKYLSKADGPVSMETVLGRDWRDWAA